MGLHMLINFDPLSPKINMHLLHTVLHSSSLWYCLREFVLTSQHFIFFDHLIHSYDLSV